MSETPEMDASIWPTEEEISSEDVLRNYRRLRELNTLNLIERGKPGIKLEKENL